MGLIPNPTDTFKKVDRTVENTEVILGRTDKTLHDVGTTLTTVDGSLDEVRRTLGDVRSLLEELRDHLQLLEAVPALTEKIDSIHRLVSGGAGPG